MDTEWATQQDDNPVVKHLAQLALMLLLGEIDDNCRQVV